MAWVRIDDDFPDHPKLAQMGDMAPLAGWQFVCILAYCNRYLTDGHIAQSKARELVTWRHVGVETGGIPGMVAIGDDMDGKWACSLLERETMLEVCSEHAECYLVHDFLDYQPSRTQVIDERVKTAERVRRHRERRNAVTKPPARNAVSNGVPVPNPVPNHESLVQSPGYPPGGAPARAREDPGFENPESDPDDLPFADWPPPTDPLGDVVENGSHSPSAEAHVFSAADVVAEYVNASRLATVACVGVPADPSRSRRGQVARVAEQLIRGHPPELLLEAARFCGEHNRPPSVFEDVVGDLERGRRPWTGDRAGSAVAARQDAHSAALRRALDMAAGVTA